MDVTAPAASGTGWQRAVVKVGLEVLFATIIIGAWSPGIQKSPLPACSNSMSAGRGICAPMLRNTAVDRDLSSAASDDIPDGLCFLSCCTAAMTRRRQLSRKCCAAGALCSWRRGTGLKKRIGVFKQLHESSTRQSSLSVSLLRLPAAQGEECCVEIGPVVITCWQ